MLWEEKHTEAVYRVPESIQDIAFRIRCSSLPVDHAWALYRSLADRLPWIDEEPEFGIHNIHVASSGNGWMRPMEPNAKLEVSRRTRMLIRTPKSRIPELMELSGQDFLIGGQKLSIQEGKAKLLNPGKTLFARAIMHPEGETEEQFYRRVAEELLDLGISVSKMLCGLPAQIHTPDANYPVRSVLISDLEPQDSFTLQRIGIGPRRNLGCGIFVPHKSLAAVGESQEST